jgi:hypothetical protein
VGPRTGLDDMEKRKFLALPRLELRPLGRPASSQSLYRLSYQNTGGNPDNLLFLLECRENPKLFSAVTRIGGKRKVCSAVARFIKMFCFVFVCNAPIECRADFLVSYIMVLTRKRASRTKKGYLRVHTERYLDNTSYLVHSGSDCKINQAFTFESRAVDEEEGGPQPSV